MDFMRRTFEVRQDPQHLLEDCRSVVMVAMSYRSSLPASFDSAEPGTVWVSRYAWGRDYHKILRKKLIRVGRWLEQQVSECHWRACVDTAPILEREWAARAGLGWIGRNTCLLNRRFGSELFLGVLLTDVELTPDTPTTDHCGKCTACLEACPTGAFVAPGVLDARRCVAYLTIEHRSGVSEHLAPLVGDMMAGCDVCQEVCPWNRRPTADLHPEFAPAEGRFRPKLETLESFDETDYLLWRRGSALRRMSFEQFRRNLVVVRANGERTAAGNGNPDTGR